MSFYIDEHGRYTEVHFNPDYPKEFKVKLPTDRAYGIPAKKWLTYTIKPYDVNSKYIQCLEPTEHAPGLSRTCGFCGKEMLNLLTTNKGLLCFMCNHITAPRFCLEALARKAYEAWDLDYDYEAYVREKEALERSYARAAEIMERWVESIGRIPVPRFTTRMAITEDKHIVYVVEKK